MGRAMGTNSGEWISTTKNQIGSILILYVILVIYMVPVVGVPIFEAEVFTGVSLWFVLGWISMLGLAAAALMYSFVIAEGDTDV